MSWTRSLYVLGSAKPDTLDEDGWRDRYAIAIIERIEMKIQDPPTDWTSRGWTLK